MSRVSPGAATPLILDGVTFSFTSGTVFHDVRATVEAGDYVVLLGSNGSGKSTLLKVALGMLEPDTGSVQLFGRPPSDARAREKVGYVPQRAAIGARVPATVMEVVQAGRAGRAPFGPFSRADRSAADEALDRVGLRDLARRRIGELSGGQQQRVLIARALASSPQLLVLDEPTAGVDRASQLGFADVLRDLNRAGVAILVVAHDLGAIGGDVGRILLLHQGHIDEISPEQAREQVGLFVEDHPA